MRFVETDLTDFQFDGQFDAIVGRFILMFLPDPVATLRSLARRLHPGGVMVFQEPSWNLVEQRDELLGRQNPVDLIPACE